MVKKGIMTLKFFSGLSIFFFLCSIPGIILWRINDFSIDTFSMLVVDWVFALILFIIAITIGLINLMKES